jgi:hypothetical protein
MGQHEFSLESTMKKAHKRIQIEARITNGYLYCIMAFFLDKVILIHNDGKKRTITT